MKYCAQCGKELSDDIRFCPECGTGVNSVTDLACDTSLTEEEKDCLNLFYRFFKYERLAWKIEGIVFLIISLFILSFGTLFMLVGISDVFFAGFGAVYVIMGLIYLPLSILSFKMIQRTEYYMQVVHTDVKPVIVRCNSVGMIVFGAFFNTIAMAFIITNFVMAKTKAKVLEEIARKQEKIHM